MEVMFYIIAGKFNPSNDDFPVKTLITKDKFADENHKLTNELLLDMLHKAIEKAIAKSGLSSIVNDVEM